MTKRALPLGLISILMLGACSSGGAATYPMSSEQAVAKLRSANAKAVGMGAKVSVSSPAKNVVAWTLGDERTSLQCTATATAAGDNESTVDVACAGGSSPSDGAAGGASADMFKAVFDEYVASTLLDRPFNKRKVEAVAVAGFAKNYPSMTKQALQMDADAQADARADAVESMADAQEDYGVDEPQADESGWAE